MTKLVVKSVIGLVLLIVVYFSLSNFKLLPDFLDFGNKFKTKELSIEPTALIVENVKSIAQLFTSNYYSEYPIIETKKTDAFFGITKDVNELIIIAKGTCYAGTDLSKLVENDIQIKDSSTCIVKIPNAEIIDIVMNPSDFDIYSEVGTWTPEEVKKAKENAKDKLKEMAIKSDVLKKANDRSKQMFTDFLASLGYKNVIVELKN